MHILNFLFSAVAFLLLLFASHLIYAKQGNQTLNRLLSVIIFTRFGQIIIYLLINSNRLTLFPTLQTLFVPLYFAAPACFYLYVKYFIRQQTYFQKSDLLHFIPFFLAIIHVFPWSFSSPINWDAIATQISTNRNLYITERTGIFPSYFYYIGQPVLVFSYLLAAWYQILSSKTFWKKQWSINKKWLFFYLSTASFFKLISLVQLAAVSLNLPFVYPWFALANCLGLLFMVVFVLHQPRLLYGYVFVSANLQANTNELQAPAIPEPSLLSSQKSPISKSKLSDQKMAEYITLMKELMEKEKPFLQADFQIIHLAQKLNLTAHHCSFVINKGIGKNFRDWINSYRIHYFIREYLLYANKMTIEALANNAGFKSMGTFYNAFKKETGLMPTAYFTEKDR